MGRSEIQQKVGIHKIVENSITPLIAGQDFIVMPDAYQTFTFQKGKTCYQFILFFRVFM